MRNILYVEQNQDGTVGGSYWCLYYILKNIDRKKVNPSVMFYDENQLFSKFSDLNIDVQVFNKPLAGKLITSSGIIGKFVNRVFNVVNTDLIPAFHFYRYIKKNRIHLVHLNNTSQGGWPWNLACKLAAIPCVTHQRVYPGSYTSHELLNANKFAAIICITSLIKDYLVKSGVDATKHVIYDALDVEEFRDRIHKNSVLVKEELGVHSNEKLVALVGNFQKWKGQHIALNALKILLQNGLNIKLMLIGDFSEIENIGSGYYREVIKLIEKNELANNVIITGYRTDIPDLVNAADLVIHTSITPEPFGMVLIEAMSIGKVVISTDIGGPLEIIDSGRDGLLIPANNSEKLAEAIVETLQNQQLLNIIPENAKSKVVKRFSIQGQVKQLVDLYDKLLGFNV